MKKRTAGVTLIEMLVVITIIGIILAATMSNLSKARKLAASKSAGAYGALVYMTVNGFMSTRPGVTASQVLAALPGSTDTNAGVPSGGRTCTSGYALAGAAGMVSATAVTSAPPNTPAWGNTPAGAHCVIVGGGVNSFATSVYSWYEGLPETVYVNGVKQ